MTENISKEESSEHKKVVSIFGFIDEKIIQNAEINNNLTIEREDNIYERL